MSEPASTATTARGSDAWHEPWLGLDSYQETDCPRFFGRAEEADELLHLVKRDILTVIFGASGTGKTSLLHAGLFPRLRVNHCLPIPIRLDYASSATDLTRQIKYSVVRAVSAADVETESRCPQPSDAEEETLWEYLHRVELWNARNEPITPVLVFDQFEEVFTLGRERPETGIFLRDLADLVESYVPAAVRARLESIGGKADLSYLTPYYKVIVSLREDFVARLDELRQLMPSIMHNRFVLKPMTGLQALQAVRGPGRGIVSDAVADEIVRFVAASRTSTDPKEESLRDLNVEPALLSLVCHELNRRRLGRGEGQITSSQVSEARGDILDDFYTRSFEGLDPRARAFVEDRLLTSTGFRTVAPREDAARVGLEGAIGRLIDRRLIRSEERLGIPHLELTHDVLVPVVQRSREQRQQIDASRAQEVEQRKTRRKAYRIAAACALLALVGAVLAAYAWQQRLKAEAMRRLALSNYLYMRSKSGSDPVDLTLLLTLEAVRLAATGDTLNTLQSVLNANSLLHGFLHGHTAWVNAVAMSGDGKLAASASLDGTVVIWDAVTGQQIGDPLRGHGASVLSVAFGPTSALVASSDAEGTVILWNLGTRTHEAMQRHTGEVWSVAFSPDGKVLASGGQDAKVIFWDVATRKALEPVLSGHGDAIRSVAFSKDGARLASSSMDQRILLWDMKTHRTVATIKVQSPAWSVDFSPDGNLLAGQQGKKIVLWNVSSVVPEEEILPNAHTRDVSSVAFSPDGATLASAAADGTIRLWDIAARRETGPPLRAHSGRVTSLAFGPGGTLVSGGIDAKVALWDLTGSHSSRKILSQRGELWTLALTPDGRALATGGTARTVVITDLTTFRPRHRLQTLSSVVSLAYSPDGRTLAIADTGGPLLLWDLATPEPHQLGSFDQLWCVRFDPTNGLLASATGDGVITLWDPARKTAVGQMNHGDTLWNIAFSPDGRLLVSAGARGTAIVWDVASRKELKRIMIPSRGMIIGLAVSPSGREVAVGAVDGTISIWNLGREDASGRPLVGYTDRVNTLAFSPDGTMLAAGGRNETIRVWDLAGDRLLYTLAGHTKWIGAVAFSPDGKMLASASDDETVGLWDMDLQSWSRRACQMANRNLTLPEWREHLGDEPYRATCQKLPAK